MLIDKKQFSLQHHNHMKNKQIHLYLAKCNNDKRLFLEFHRDNNLEKIIRNIPGIKWSAIHQSWHIAYNLETLKQLEVRFRDVAGLNFKTNNAKIKMNIKSVRKTESEPKNSEFKKPDINEFSGANDDNELDFGFNAIAKSIDKFEIYLKHKRYSESTMRIYCEAVKRFLFFVNLPVDEIDNDDLITFNNYLRANGYSYSFQNQVASGLKLFFDRIHEKKFDPIKIERPRRENKLPNVLSKDEIQHLLAAPVNIKHRTMLILLYACGLRRSELLNLQPGDIDSKRGLVIIRQGKGRKDRIVPLPVKVLEMLRTYYRACRPVKWLFEGQVKASQYSPTSLAKVLKNSANKAGIKKPVTLHWLRHSYATHLLEQGTDLRIIQELLGHKSSKTTEIYTHVSTKNIQQIKSPFDDIDI